MMRLGHIDYANCFPIHARFIDQGPPPDIELMVDVPSGLNHALATGAVDVAPCSSIEYARHADRYRLLPDFVIGSYGPVESILLESTTPVESLGGVVAVPTASATSVALLRILLERRYHRTPRLEWFDQAADDDPVAGGAVAALRIGDVALRREFPAGRRVYDLGTLWTEWTGLPFAFAVWQTGIPATRDEELVGLHAALLSSRAFYQEHLQELAQRHARRFRLPADRLARYWRSLRFDLDGEMQRGLLHFYTLAAAVGEAQPVRALTLLDIPPR